MHLWSLSALVLTATIRSVTFATPIVGPQSLPRNHVQCNAANELCQVQQTCDNAPSIVAGTVPKPWPSSVATLVNPVPALETLANGASGVSASRKLETRLQNTVQWCALGTEVYILLVLQGTQGAAAIKSTLGTAIRQVETQMDTQTANESETGIAAGSAPVYSLAGAVGSNAKITATNAAGVNLTWVELELGLLMIVDWMDNNSYGWGSASVWDGADEVGLVYITV